MHFQLDFVTRAMAFDFTLLRSRMIFTNQSDALLVLNPLGDLVLGELVNGEQSTVDKTLEPVSGNISKLRMESISQSVSHLLFRKSFHMTALFVSL